MWSFVRKWLGVSPARHTGVPTAVVDRSGVEVRFSDREPWRIEWSRLTELGVNVVVNHGPTGDYSEGFWTLKGRTTFEGFEVPVEMVAGSEALNDRLFDLPGFDPAQYVRARKAEANAQPGYFVCWRREPSEPVGSPP